LANIGYLHVIPDVRRVSAVENGRLIEREDVAASVAERNFRPRNIIRVILPDIIRMARSVPSGDPGICLVS